MKGKGLIPTCTDRPILLQICTEILYQPLALLDCLHSFCGACLQEWFKWQATSAAHKRRTTNPYSCPSCRESVRGTKADWRLTTLLEGYLKANPERARSEQEKEELRKHYKPGDDVLARVQSTLLEDDSEEERLVAVVRDMSMADVDPEIASRRERRMNPSRVPPGRSQQYSPEELRRRQQSSRWVSQQVQLTESRLQEHDADHAQVEHQPSLRSLLSASDADPHDVQAEVLQSISAEGLLNGIDLDNLTTEQEEELTERIAEAYRRRQRRRDRSRNREHREGESRSPRLPAATVDSSARNRTAPDSVSSQQPQSRARPPISRPHLFEQPSPRGQRSSSATSHRSNRSTNRHEDRSPAARSATDLSQQPSTDNGQREARRRVSSTGRSVTDPETGGMREQIHRYRESSGNSRVDGGATRPQYPNHQSSEAIRLGPRRGSPSSSPPPINSESQQAVRPAASHPAFAPEPIDDTTNLQSAPSIKCNRCDQPEIQYDLHYNCPWCLGGGFNLCLRCYRDGQGCNHWFGFGWRAVDRWYRTAPPEGWPIGFDRPHTLAARRYVKGADVSQRNQRITHLADSIQEGAFCESCFAFANECYWYCNVCLEGAWGFCNNCVNQGKHCTHPLQGVVHLSELRYPLYDPSKASFLGLPHLRQDSYLPLPVITGCNVCHRPIPPNSTRFHCYQCNDGDYDICNECYRSLVTQGKISQTNGPNGWRRCLQGHRMAVIGYQDTLEGGHLRITDAEQVGGRTFKEDEISLSSQPPLGGYPPNGGIGMSCLAIYSYFPKGAVNDELAFPKNAEIREVEDMNGDWFWGYLRWSHQFIPKQPCSDLVMPSKRTANLTYYD